MIEDRAALDQWYVVGPVAGPPPQATLLGETLAIVNREAIHDGRTLPATLVGRDPAC